MSSLWLGLFRLVLILLLLLLMLVLLLLLLRGAGDLGVLSARGAGYWVYLARGMSRVLGVLGAREGARYWVYLARGGQGISCT